MINLSIDDLVEKHWLSVRSINVCKCNNLNSLSDILDYFREQKGFLRLRNCGEKSNQELMELCMMYLAEYQRNEEGDLSVANDPSTLYNSFDPFKKSIVNRFFYGLFHKLNIRAANGVVSLCGSYQSVQKILYILYVRKVDFKDIKNIGELTTNELIGFRNQLASFIQSLSNLSSDTLNKTYLKLIIESAFNYIDLGTVINIDTLFTSNEKVRIFKLIHELVEKEVVFNKNQTSIFLNIYIKEKPNLQRIAQQLDLTRERVRQITKDIEESFHSIFGFIQNLSLNDCETYGLINEDEFLIVDENFASKINNLESLSFNPFFYANITTLLLGDSYITFDPTLSNLKRASVTERSTCKSFYVIRKHLTEKFDFDLFLLDLKLKFSQKITEPYELYFEGYLFEFFRKKLDIPDIEKVKSICERMIYSEFDMVISSSGYLVFGRNVKKQLHEYIKEVLAELGEMSHIQRILSLAETKFPEIEFNEQSVRSTMQREKDVFIYIGRSSTYGLKQWESENETLRGGTIRELVEEYLKSSDTPMHISEILDYVNQFRNTNSKSVMSNIEFEENGKFRIFPGDFVGLNRKNYTNTAIYKGMNGSHFHTSYIQKMNNWPIDDVVRHYMDKYNYLDVQVRAALLNRVKLGDFVLTHDDKLII